MDEKKTKNLELLAFRAEAEELFGNRENEGLEATPETVESK